MPANTGYMDDGKYTVTSSLSVVASRATVATQDLVVASAASFGGTIYISSATLSPNAVIVNPGTAVGPTVAFFQSSSASLGFYASATSTIAISYGTLDLRGANLAFSSGTTAQSASTAKVGQGQMVFSVLSLTTNGAALYFRSGNSTYVWPSSGVIG